MKSIVLVIIFLVLITSLTYSQEPTQPLQLTVKPEKQVSGIGEIIIISGEIKNVSNQDIFIYSLEKSLTVTYDVIDYKGNKIDVPLPIIDLWTPKKDDFVLLKPGNSLPKNFKLFFPKEIIKSGLYTISVKYEIWDKGYYKDGKFIDLGAWTGTLASNIISIDVVEKLLTQQDAIKIKEALIDFMENSKDEDIKILLKDVKSVKPEVDENSIVRIGTWQYNEKENVLSYKFPFTGPAAYWYKAEIGKENDSWRVTEIRRIEVFK